MCKQIFDEMWWCIVGIGLIATDAAASLARLRTAVPALPQDLRMRASRAAARLEPRLGGGRVFADDRAPVEWLLDASIVEFAAGSEGDATD